jgi:ATP-dependent Clp protease ATP-binding subunit ClpX
MTQFAIFSMLFFTAFAILAVTWCARTILRRNIPKVPKLPLAGTETEDGALLYCSFCGKDQHAVRKLIAGPEVFICDECVERSAKSARSPNQTEWNAAAQNLPKPADIHATFDPYLAGGTAEKRRLAVTLHTYYRYLTSGARTAGVELPWPKPNILLAGPDPSRERDFAHGLAQTLDVPFEMVDAAVFMDRDDLFERMAELVSALDRKAGSDPARARRAIVYIDGIEQVRRIPTVKVVADCPEPPENDGWEASDAQAALIAQMTGARLWIKRKPIRLNPDNNLDFIDTTAIIFICGIALNDPAAPIQATKMGELPGREELHRFGFIPDLIGRLPVKFAMDGPCDG